jgi:hypothetical protein
MTSRRERLTSLGVTAGAAAVAGFGHAMNAAFGVDDASNPAANVSRV